MNRYRMQFAPQVWKPKLNPLLVKALRPLRIRNQMRAQQLVNVDVVGADHVRTAVGDGRGVMIMPNHCSHADPFAIYAAADSFGTPIHVMATWHVFWKKSRIMRRILQWHGCFSVDREANDISAFRLAVDILRDRREPLVIFPEGEIYHCNDRVTPFREGAAAVAIAAARRATRPIVCVPCAITYRFIDDPTPALVELMGELEEAILWRRQSERPLHERIYRFAEALLGVKEVEYFGAAQTGLLPDRIKQLRDEILSRVEQRHGLSGGNISIPERIKAARRTIIERLGPDGARGIEAARSDAEKCSLEEDLEDLFLVVQSFSYPGDYVAQKPSIERMAETLDKFEEDVLRRPTAAIRGRRSVKVQFGTPVELPTEKSKDQASHLSQQIESEVQTLLEQGSPDKVA